MNSQTKHLNTWVAGWIASRKLPKSTRWEALAGDGSTRSFYRIRGPDQTHILLFDRDWILSKDYPAHQAYLAERGIPVPEFLTVDPGAGCLVMQDLGDELLQFRILAEPERKSEWLRRATRLLADLHGRTYPVPADLPVSTRSFDQAKLFQEFLFTEEHLVRGLLKLSPWSNAQKQTVEAFCGNLASIRPLVFAHRDYHTRNLLVIGEALVMIDFQDARLGPPHYDLASLLYDAYVPVPEEEKRALVALYTKSLKAYPGLEQAIDFPRFDSDLAQIAFQRVVKAAGSFASFFTRYAKRTHLPYLRPALESARGLRGHVPAELADVIDIERWLEKVQQLDLAG